MHFVNPRNLVANVGKYGTFALPSPATYNTTRWMLSWSRRQQPHLSVAPRPSVRQYTAELASLQHLSHESGPRGSRPLRSLGCTQQSLHIASSQRCGVTIAVPLVADVGERRIPTILNVSTAKTLARSGLATGVWWTTKHPRAAPLYMRTAAASRGGRYGHGRR